MILVSSTEPAALLPGHLRNTIPEAHGVDVLWSSEAYGGLCGVQRKEVKDYIASLRDGRLGKELLQMGELKWVCLILEGVLQWNSDGVLVASYGAEFTKTQLAMSLLSIQERGIRLVFTSSLAETTAILKSIFSWTKKDSHNSLLNRGDASQLSTWGIAGTKEYSIYLLMGLPGISHTLAERVYDHFGKVPMRWECTMAELMEVKGIGKGRAEKMWKVLAATE